MSAVGDFDWLAYRYRNPVDIPAEVALRCSAAKTKCCADDNRKSDRIFLYTHHGQILCHPCIRRNLTMPDIAEIETALRAIGKAATFGCADAECSECHGPRPVVWAR
jgi:hypothetical protein